MVRQDLGLPFLKDYLICVPFKTSAKICRVPRCFEWAGLELLNATSGTFLDWSWHRGSMEDSELGVKG